MCRDDNGRQNAYSGKLVHHAKRHRHRQEKCRDAEPNLNEYDDHHQPCRLAKPRQYRSASGRTGQQ